MAKTVDLQPFLDYFYVLQTYVEKGLLNIEPEKYDAYITKEAIYSLSPAVDDDGLVSGDKYTRFRIALDVMASVRHIRAFAGYLSQKGKAYLDHDFAVHVVNGEYPYDLQYTVVMTRKRFWWRLWTKTDVFEVIPYSDDKHG